MQFKFVYLFFLFIAIIACNRPVKHKNIQLVIDLERGNQVSIYNKSESSSCFYLKLNNGFLSQEEIIEYVKSMPNQIENESLARKAWRFVMDKIYYLPSFEESNKFHHPLTLINSLGYGQCDDLSAALAIIWKDLGYNSRVWELGGHIVPEVYENGKWKMYDPSFQVYYLTRDSLVASVEELESNTDLILSPVEKLDLFKLNKFTVNTVDTSKLKELYNSYNYSPRMKEYYETEEDNVLNEWFEKTYSQDSVKICLPKGALMRFPVCIEHKFFDEQDWFGNDFTRSCFLAYSVPNNNIEIELPFVYFEDSDLGTTLGKEEFKIGKLNSNKGNVSNEYLCLLNFDTQTQTGSMILSSIDTTSLSVEVELNK